MPGISLAVGRSISLPTQPRIIDYAHRAEKLQTVLWLCMRVSECAGPGNVTCGAFANSSIITTGHQPHAVGNGGKKDASSQRERK